MWYILLILYAYCGVLATFVAAELDRRAGRDAYSDFRELLGLAWLPLFFWPFAVAELYKDWND